MFNCSECGWYKEENCVCGYSNKIKSPKFSCEAWKEKPSSKNLRWTPVTERLPETESLCCDDKGNMIIGYPFADGESDNGYSAESDGYFMYNCVAWMPLPEAYNGSD